MTNSTTQIPAVKIPSDVSHAQAYAYGYITQGLKNIGYILKQMNDPACPKARREQYIEHLAIEVGICLAMDEAYKNHKKN
jgi:hypothetical protein